MELLIASNSCRTDNLPSFVEAIYGPQLCAAQASEVLDTIFSIPQKRVEGGNTSGRKWI